MSWPNLVVVVRHGESEGNVKFRDDQSLLTKPNHAFGLTNRGFKQAQVVANRLSKTQPNFDAVFCSTFLRTQQTAGILAPYLSPIIDSRLNELWRGIWYTMTPEQIAQHYPCEAEIKAREGAYHYRPPGGQNCPDVELNIHSFVQTLCLHYSGKNILVSAHGNWMLLFWRIFANRTPDEYLAEDKTGRYLNGTYSVYQPVNNQLTFLYNRIMP